MRPEKAFIVEDLLSRLQASPFLIITDYHGLKVDQFSELRTRLAGAGAKYTVVKNTFLNRAAREAGLPDLGESLTGQTAIVTGDKDVSAAAKILRTFATESKKLTVRAGVVDKSLFTDKQLGALADLPSKEVLQSQLARPAPDPGDAASAHDQRTRQQPRASARGAYRKTGRNARRRVN